MTKEQAKLKFKEEMIKATQILEDLVKEGRLSKDGNNNPQRNLEEIRDLRQQWGNEAAEFIEDNWVSFDGNPSAADLAAAVKEDEGDDNGGAETNGNAEGEGDNSEGAA